MSPTKLVSDVYSEEETIARREATLKRMLSTPPKHQKDSKLGKRRESASDRKKP
jgi:hypothetical protein